jgi:hypothetical protein
LLLSIVALADCSCEDFAISQKVKHRKPDGGSHNPTREKKIQSVVFWAWQKTASCIKLGLAVSLRNQTTS